MMIPVSPPKLMESVVPPHFGHTKFRSTELSTTPRMAAALAIDCRSFSLNFTCRNATIFSSSGASSQAPPHASQVSMPIPSYEVNFSGLLQFGQFIAFLLTWHCNRSVFPSQSVGHAVHQHLAIPAVWTPSLPMPRRRLESLAKTPPRHGAITP